MVMGNEKAIALKMNGKKKGNGNRTQNEW